MPGPRILKTQADIEQGVEELIKQCARMKALYSLVGRPALRRRRAGFPGLARIITEQQLSTASAAAIWTRVEALATPFSAEAVLELSPEALKQAGLSAAKISTLLGLAERLCDNVLNLGRLHRATPDTIRETLITVPGIGPWTADIYTLFCLGHADAFAAGDLALQTSAQLTFEMNERPSVRDLEALADQWRPWRGIAARLLWSSYRSLKTRSLKTGAKITL
jgi:DNA-3-methyladenine glycosylase II